MKNKKQLNPSVVISKNVSADLSSFLRKKNYSRCFILTDDNTHRECLPVLLNEKLKGKAQPLQSATVIKVYAGEQHKSLQAAEYIWRRLTEENADRRSVLINLGGGVICDLGGFVASTYKRGIDFIHVPTSLLAMCDAAIGGKQGVDFHHYKNQIGIFKNPERIFISEKFLKTLPPAELTSGFAEVVKHALIAGGKFWKEIQLTTQLDNFDWKKIISESIDVKLAVVERDPLEMNYRKVLNFGHTIGHALESFLLSKYQNTFHGYCVAAGMIAELYLSGIVCGLPGKKQREAVTYIRKHFPEINFSKQDFDVIISLMKHDKKNENGKIRMVLLKKFGEPVIDQEVNEILIREALRYIQSEQY